MIYLTIFCVVLLFLLFWFIFLYGEFKADNFRLNKTNNRLTEEITSYKASNAKLSYKINELTNLTDEQRKELDELLSQKEIFNFAVDSKVKWFDSGGETEYGIVCDDFFSDNKHFVVVRGINKKGKVTGRYFTISAHKITAE